MSIKESIKEELSRSSVWVYAKKGRGHWQSGCISPIPKEIKDLVKQNHQKRKEEDKRFANLSPAEKEKEMDKALKGLSKQKGFFVVGIKK